MAATGAPTIVPRSWVLLWTWEIAWGLAVFSWILNGPLERGTLFSRAAGSARVPLPLLLAGLSLLFVAGPLCGRLLVAAIRKTPRGRAFLDKPVRSLWALNWFSRWTPALALRIDAVFTAALVVLLVLAWPLLSAIGILPEPGTTGAVVFWAAVCIAALAVAAVTTRPTLARDESDDPARQEGRVES